MCFSADWLIHTLVWFVVVCGIVAILRLVLPWLLAWLGIGVDAMVMRVIQIVIAVIVIVWLIYFIYDLVLCVGYSGPRVR